MSESRTVTRLLERWHEGDQQALDALLPLVYEQLRQIADQRLARELAPNIQLEPTELVHEAYLRLADGNAVAAFNGRAHFYAIAARLMRQILVDRARARRSGKRDGGQRVTLSGLPAPTRSQLQIDLLDLDEALDRLHAIDARKAKVIELRLFGGMQYDEISQITGLSRATLDRDFRTARAWLYKELNP